MYRFKRITFMQCTFYIHTSIEIQSLHSWCLPSRFLQKETLFSTPTKQEAAAPIDVHAEAQVAVVGFSWRVPTTGGWPRWRDLFPDKNRSLFCNVQMWKNKERASDGFLSFFVRGKGGMKFITDIYVGFMTINHYKDRYWSICFFHLGVILMSLLWVLVDSLEVLGWGKWHRVLLPKM